MLTESEPEDAKQPIKRGKREEKKPSAQAVRGGGVKKTQKRDKLERVVEDQVEPDPEGRLLIKVLSQCLVTLRDLATATDDVANGTQVTCLACEPLLEFIHTDIRMPDPGVNRQSRHGAVGSVKDCQEQSTRAVRPESANDCPRHVEAGEF